MSTVNINIDGKAINVPHNITILKAAKLAGISIPTLCHLDGSDFHANCRICVVEVVDTDKLLPSCAAKVKDGMIIYTNSPAVFESRRNTIMNLLRRHPVGCHHCLRIGMSHCEDLDPKACEMCFFCDCVREGFCELQSLAREYKIDVLPFEVEIPGRIRDCSTPVVRDTDKCVHCKLCVGVCNTIQSVGNLVMLGKGETAYASTVDDKQMAESACVGCGRCVDVCPTGATYMAEHKDELIYYIHSYENVTVAQISYNILPELQKLYKMDSLPDIKSVVYGLKKIGIDYAFTEDYALWKSQEQARKLMEENGEAPTIITCSYSAKKYAAANFPELAVKSYPNAQQVFGDIIRKDFASKNSISLDKLKVISFTNDNENAVEATQSKSADIVVNARELYRIFIRTGVDLKRRYTAEPDSLGSQSALQEGLLANVKWAIDASVQEFEGKAALGPTLGLSKKLMEEVKEGSSTYKVIRIHA